MINLDIARQRLHNQLITRSMFEKPEDVVQWLGAVQAKEYRELLPISYKKEKRSNRAIFR